MDSIKYIISFICIFSIFKVEYSFSQNYLSYSERKNLPELATKQSIDNLRFISHNAKFTYYQKRNGHLNFSTNYKVTPTVKSTPGANFLISSTPFKKRIIIEEDKTYNSYYGIRKLQNIYVANYGKEKSDQIGVGIGAQLHLKDKWISFYNPQQKFLSFKNLDFSTFKFQIQIGKNINPYFIPQVIMPSDGDVFYTNLNKKGIPQIFHYERKTKKSKNVYTGSSHQFKIELCLNQSSIIIGEFNLYNDKALNIISIMDKSTKDLSKRSILYEAPNKDIGNLICNLDNDNLFFIKNTKTKPRSKNQYEAVKLNIKTKKIKILSNIQYATQIINMDGKLLLPYRGKFYLLLGENNLAIIDRLNDTDGNKKEKEK